MREDFEKIYATHTYKTLKKKMINIFDIYAVFFCFFFWLLLLFCFAVSALWQTICVFRAIIFP